MELQLEVVLSSSIKRKKPWPRFCWLGKEKESVFMLDDKRISEINMISGRTRKRTPKLHPLLNSVVKMTSSSSGSWLCGLLASGELFLWNRDKDVLKMAAAVPEVAQMIATIQGNPTRLTLQVSGDGMRVLVVVITGLVFLWECADVRDLSGVRDGTARGRWSHILPLDNSALPCAKDKEASQHSSFIKSEVMGDSCLSAFVFTSGKKLVITFFRIQWDENCMSAGSVGYSVQWATRTYPLSRLTPPCQPVKSRGALVSAFAPDGQLLAVVLNQRQPKATQVLFVSTQNFVTVSSGLGGCGSRRVDIPSKYIRSYWVASVSWSPGGLFLACVLKRGSLLMLCRLGGLLTLTSTGCSVEFGPAHFLPLHPLVTYRPPTLTGNASASLSSSSMSVRDVFRQRYSVTWHPRLSYFIVSDGYMATVLRLLDKPSPALLMRTLLQDATKELEKATEKLEKSQMGVGAWLDSVSSLNPLSRQSFNSTDRHGSKTTNSVLSAAPDSAALPLFLQDHGTFSSTRELLGNLHNFFEDDSDLEGPPAGSHLEDGGRLDFASMFDTLHALDTQTNTSLLTIPDSEKESITPAKRTPVPHRELSLIQTKLLTAWVLGMSPGAVVEERTVLLQYCLRCVGRLAAVLRLSHSLAAASGGKGKRMASFPAGVLHLLRSLLSFLPWDVAQPDVPHCLGPVVGFTKRLVRLLLTPCPPDRHGCQVSSRSLSTALHVLEQVSECLDHTYGLQQRATWTPAEKEPRPPRLWMSDLHHVPQLHSKEAKSSPANRTQSVPQQPSSRLQGAWQWLYKVSQQYMEGLKGLEGHDGWEEEQQQLSAIMSQIQAALQATGGKLEEGPVLLSHPGEHLFLCGSYWKSCEMWHSQICEGSVGSCARRVYKETQLCLALLYSLLSQYRLRETQELGDHMARLLLQQTGHLNNTAAARHHWLPPDLHSDAALAVIQTLGRFMASYFTNQPLYIRPPHHVASLPPLHLPCSSASVGRLLLLCQEEVSRAVRQQQLSEVWSVDYTQDLLLLGGLLPESVWLASRLGDWKSAASLSLAFSNYCGLDLARLRRAEFHLPAELQPDALFRVELQRLLGDTSDPQKCAEDNDLLEGEDWDVLQISIQEILKASVMAGVDVLSAPLTSLLDTAKNLSSLLPVLVPSGLYLPSPPLYCPQPSANTQDPAVTAGESAEAASRRKVSAVLQRLLLLLRSARCCHPAAQWYISHLRRARHIVYKIKKKYPYPSVPEQETDFPEGLAKFITRQGFFKRGSIREGQLDPDIVQTIVCFRELCALCWMLHVRDQLSISCRKYQAARQLHIDQQLPCASDVTSNCVDALCWARRLLPFACFLNAEEILQDLLLSLVSALPPLSLVAETVVEAFLLEEESVRVALREKYSSLLQRLRHSNVLEGDESMRTVIQDKRRQRRKHLGRLRRHLAPTELHLWEVKEGEEERESKRGAAAPRQPSPSKSGSDGTLTNRGFPPVCSDDGDTADALSEAISPDAHSRAAARGKKGKKGRKHANPAVVQKINTELERLPEDSQRSGRPPLPTVGTWEFELEDEEYLRFLDLLLSYMLGKDGADGGESGGELPLLKGFSSQLRDGELHSLAFDALTSAHRRQTEKKDKGPPPVFRAGCCYKPVQRRQQKEAPESQTSSIWNEELVSVSSLPGLQKGLFGLRRQEQSRGSPGQKLTVIGDSSTLGGSFSAAQLPESSPMLGSSTYVEAGADLQQGLDSKLEAQFPKLGRLLEWMVRWAVRRAPLRHQTTRRSEKAPAGVVMRVKSSTPAVLASLDMLRRRLDALLGPDRHVAHMQVPETRWTAAPALQPVEVDRRLQGDSGLEEAGSPGSGSAPLTVVDQEELSVISPTDEPEEAPPPDAQPEPTADAEPRASSPQPLSLDDLDVTPEKEGRSSSSSEAADDSQIVSDRSVAEISCLPDRSLQLEDLEVMEDANDAASLSVLTQAVPQPEPQAPPPNPPTSLPPPPPAAAVPPATDTPLLLADTPVVESPGLQPRSSTSAASPGDPAALGQPPQLRQRLGDDLIRLVQNINYVSLMEVLAASFSNLQLAQQQQQQQYSSLAQSNMNFSHPDEPPLIPAASLFFPPPAQPNTSVGGAQGPGSTTPLLRHIPACAGQSAGSARTSGYSQPNLPATSHGESVNQDLQPLSIQAVLPDVQLRDGRGLMSPPQGLLATTDSALGQQVAPSLNYAPQNGPQLAGPKLLQLHPSLLTSDGDPGQTSPSRRSEPRSSTQLGNAALRGRLAFSCARDSAPSRVVMSETSRCQEVPLPVLPSPTRAPAQGLRLLQYHSPPQNNVSELKLPRLPFFRPAPGISVPMADVPIKLLQIESGPKKMLPWPVHPLLTGSAFDREHRPQQLRVEPRAESTSRQKRREEKEGRRRKSEVTNESVIPLQQPIKEPVIQGGAAEPPVTPERDSAGHVGSADSLLTGARLLQRAVPTSAELHAFASTCKNPPECHDAFTNTDPSCRPALVDKAVSVSAPASRRQSLNSENLPCSAKHLVPDSQVISGKAERNPGVGGRQFLSVWDLENRELHQDLPPSLGSARHPPPTSAQLHALATSVLCSASPSNPQSRAASPQRLQRSASCTGHSGTPRDARSKSPSSRRSEPKRDVERVAVEDVEAPSDSELCRAARSPFVGPQHVSPKRPASLFSSRLSEMDAQLAALQGIADSLETDFSNTKMMVKTSAKLKTTDGKTAAAGKKTVRLSVPQKAWGPRPNIPTGQKTSTVAEKGQFEEPPLRRDASTPQRRASSSASSSPRSPSAAPSALPTPPRTKDELDDMSGLSTLCQDESLAQSGLYDTAEILDELVREGYLSSADLDFTSSLRAAQNSRLERRQSSSRMSQESDRDSERRELRIWMRRRQREQLAVYQKHRERLRERERQPFPRTVTPTNRHPLAYWRTREEREKLMLLEHYKQRTSQAWSLVRSLPASPLSQRTPSVSQLSATPPPVGLQRTYDISVSDRTKNSPGQSQQLPQYGTAVMRAGLTEEQRRRLGLHRPVTCLPGDRLSHVTRRGMLSDPRSHSRMSLVSHSEERSVASHQRKTTIGGGRGSTVGGGVPRKQTVSEERRQSNHWEANRQQEEESDLILAGLSDEQEPVASDMDWLDNLSESGGSNISKIDWAAIERMVATGES